MLLARTENVVIFYTKYEILFIFYDFIIIPYIKPYINTHNITRTLNLQTNYQFNLCKKVLKINVTTKSEDDSSDFIDFY